MAFHVREVIHASAIGFGFVLIWALPLLPANWIYNRLAVRAAIRANGDSMRGATVASIEKPSTITFSNGAVVDVGLIPATVSSAFHLITFFIGAGLYGYKLRHQIRTLTKPEG